MSACEHCGNDDATISLDLCWDCALSIPDVQDDDGGAMPPPHEDDRRCVFCLDLLLTTQEYAHPECLEEAWREIAFWRGWKAPAERVQSDDPPF